MSLGSIKNAIAARFAAVVKWLCPQNREEKITKEQKEQVVKKNFTRRVDDVVRLLDFMTSERHSYHVPDNIIDAIEKARQVDMSDQIPTQDDRALLSKTHRDLILVPDASVIYSGVPPAEFWCWRSLWTWSMICLCAAPTLVVFVYVNRLWWQCREEWSFTWHSPLIYAGISGSLIWALYVFTGVVTDKKLNRIIGTCYAFTVLSVALSVTPFLFEGNNLRSRNAQIGLLKGCVGGADGTIPGLVKCGSGDLGETSQWVLNIGGLAKPRLREAPDPSLIPTLTLVPALTLLPALSLVPALTLVPATAQATADVYKISGGLVVPLYVIVLAMIGSAISMTRRVPEYQRRAMSAQDPMTNTEARERLVFQIMQVLSAPLIAITAFSIVKPATISEAVVIGFGSGFASEPILLMIRGLVDKISPAPSAPDGSVAVKVTPTTSNPKPGESITFTAQVTGAPNTAVTWKLEGKEDLANGTITPAGLYTAPASVAAEKTVTVTATSTVDLNRSGSASIKLAPVAVQPPTDPVAVKVSPPKSDVKPSDQIP